MTWNHPFLVVPHLEMILILKRMNSVKVLLNAVASSHVASSTDWWLHWTSTFEKIFPFWRTFQYFIMSFGSSNVCWFRNSTGNGLRTTEGSPTNFFNFDTWNTLWSLADSGNFKRYATTPILSTIWNGPKKPMGEFVRGPTHQRWLPIWFQF